MRTLATLLLAASLVGLPQTPPPSIGGVWVLKSVTVGGKAATAKEMSGLLIGLGGVESGMVWKLRKPDENNKEACDLNGTEGGYELVPETRELILESENKDGEFKQTVDVRLTEKNMKLRYRKNGKPVELLMVRQD